MTDRDFAVEMRRFIDEHTATGAYVPRIAASEIVDKLRANDADLLAGWLDQQAVHFIWQAINDRDRSIRSGATERARRRAFSQAAQEGGDRLHAFLEVPYTVEDGSRRPLARLTRADLLFVAGEYDARAARNRFHASFIRALAKRVKTGTVADHFTEEQVASMWTSLS